MFLDFRKHVDTFVVPVGSSASSLWERPRLYPHDFPAKKITRVSHGYGHAVRNGKKISILQPRFIPVNECSTAAAVFRVCRIGLFKAVTVFAERAVDVIRGAPVYGSIVRITDV